MKQMNCMVCGKLINQTSYNRKYCDGCRKIKNAAYKRKWYNENLEKGRSYFKKWSKKNREKYLKGRRKKYAENPEKYIKATVEWGKNNPEKKREKDKRWRLKNPEKNKEMKRQYSLRNRKTIQEYRKRNKEHIKEIKKAWVEKNRQHVRRKNLHRQAIRKNAVGSHTTEEFLMLCEKYQWVCVYCGCDLDEKSVTEDHMIPLSKGGSDNISNIAPSCSFCNGSKNNKTAEEFMKLIEERKQSA